MVAANDELGRQNRKMNPDKLEDLRDDLEERQADQEDMSNLLAEPMGGAMDMEDDDELLAELDELTGIGIGEDDAVGTKVGPGTSRIDLPVVPNDKPVVLPDVPTMDPTPSKEADELANLEAMLN